MRYQERFDTASFAETGLGHSFERRGGRLPGARVELTVGRARQPITLKLELGLMVRSRL